MPNTANLFHAIPADLPDELKETLLSADTVRIERIVSRGQVSPSDHWYDQAEHEWVLLLAGTASIQFEDGSLVDLTPGSYVNLPAHVRHRVAATDLNEATIWLAVFYRDGEPR